jgi:hypothetical protein
MYSLPKMPNQKYIDQSDENLRNFMEGSAVVKEDGSPKVVYSGHSNTNLFGSSFDKKRATAGGFYFTANPEIASNYAKDKIGVAVSLEKSCYDVSKNPYIEVDGLMYVGDAGEKITFIGQKVTFNLTEYAPQNMALVVSPKLYSNLKTELNDVYNFSGTVEEGTFKGINGVAVFEALRLPSGVDYALVTMDSVAQPALITGVDVEKIPLSNDYAISVFYRYGTKTLAKELALYGSVNA